MDVVEAGYGEHRCYLVRSSGTDQARLTAKNHYLGIDAVAWFLRKEGSWFTKRTASGTLEITMGNGLENYQAALGTLDLVHETYTAPIFGRPVLPDRNFRGGPITLKVSLWSLEKDRAITALLKSAANASLGIIGGVVQTYSVAGPAQVLTAAGNELISGVRTMLSDTAPHREPVFDPGGFEVNVQPEDVVGRYVYLLLHRGSNLQPTMVSVRKGAGDMLLPFYGDGILTDGAWILLRLRRSDDYSGVRAWFDTARQFRTELDALVNDIKDGPLTKEEGLARLQPTTSGTSLYDQFMRLRETIGHDAVLTERQAGTYASDLQIRVRAARAAIASGDYSAYAQAISNAREVFTTGALPTGILRTDIQAAFANVASVRGPAPSRLAKESRVASLQGLDLFDSLRFQRRTLSDLGVADAVDSGSPESFDADVATLLPSRAPLAPPRSVDGEGRPQVQASF